MTEVVGLPEESVAILVGLIEDNAAELGNLGFINAA
jgi:hypothetical protein